MKYAQWLMVFLLLAAAGMLTLNEYQYKAEYAELSTKYRGAIRANRILAELYVQDSVASATVEMAKQDNDLIVRLNGQHYHWFKNACDMRL